MSRLAVATSVERLPGPPHEFVPAAARAETLDTLVVIGNGMAGHRLCQALVRLDAHRRYQVVVFGEESSPAYDRVHLTDVFNGREEDDLLLAPMSWYGDHGIDLRLGDPVVDIDRHTRTVRSASGERVGYRSLVFATGSSPYVPPIEGTGLSNVFRYRTLCDAYAIRERARSACTAAVIGGGLLGLEAARALQGMGLELLILEAAAAVMPTQLDQAAGRELERQIAALGIRVETTAMTKRIEADGLRRRLVFGDGTSVTVDMVIVAAGVRPRTELAARCGLACSPTGGIAVDDHLQTSDQHIHAIGECASHRSQTWALVAPAYAMADALAENLMGGSSPFLACPPPTRLKLLGVEVATAGEPLERGTVLQYGSTGIYRRLRLERGRLVGALGVGEWAEFRRIQDATARRQRIWPWQLARFERTGEVWASRNTPAASEWPADAVVCDCLSVTRGRLAAACASGASTLELVVERTGASTLCGSCRPLVAELVGVSTPTPAPPRWGLLVASAVAVALVSAIAFSSPVPFSASVQETFTLDVLWRNGALRQFTGFTLLGLSAAASLLTLRKRLPHASLGAYATWRTTHAVIGVLTLLTLAVHTGMRLGENANFALMASFGTLNVAGAAAGGVTALERAFGSTRGSRARQVVVAAHILATWPLPLLIAFHVVSVYYF
jgi:nitrite reductase (NADH) large subunit